MSLWDDIKEAWDQWQTAKKSKKPDDVPLGTGAADKAKKKIKSRRQQIEDAVEKAESGDGNSSKSN